jgi:hypothetical protein
MSARALVVPPIGEFPQLIVILNRQSQKQSKRRSAIREAFLYAEDEDGGDEQDERASHTPSVEC